MSPQVRAALAGYPYQPAPPAPPDTTGGVQGSTLPAGSSGGPLSYDPRALLEATRVPNEPPPGYQGAPPGWGGAPTTEAEYYKQKWQYELLNDQAARQEQRRQFDLREEAMRNESLLNRFGQYTPTTAPPSGAGLAGQQMAARSAISDERIKAQQQRAEWQQAVGAQEAAAAAGPQVYTPELNPLPLAGLPEPYSQRHALGPQEAQLLGPYQPRPQWLSGPQFGMSVDESARNTMRGNEAFGIHLDRGNTVGRGAASLNNLAQSSIGSEQGEADYARLERLVLGDPNDPAKFPASPRASILLREEDPGVHATPEERAYLAMRRRRRQLGGSVRGGGGTPYDQPAY